MPKRPINHSKKRRDSNHNYSLPGTYLLTIVVEGRLPVFGTLIDTSEPYIELSPLGKRVAEEEIFKIHAVYPNVQVWKYIIMPDHIHLIVHVDKPFPRKKHLGNVVYGFKTGCTRAWWRLQGWLPDEPTPGGETPGTVAGLHGVDSPKSATVPGVCPPGLPSRLPLLFEEGYNDGILMNNGQLDRWKHYLVDNPRRLAIKRRHPSYFTVIHDLDICGRKCQITGNRFLLDIPDKMAVIVHRADSDADFEEHRRQWLACGERGGVLVSAAVAPREKEVMREAMNRGYRIILLRENGFNTPYKPSGEAFDACAQGQLLQISPWKYHYDRHTITRVQCLFLNELAGRIVSDTTWY